jgi:broad specificity phosphatase PhoE
VTTVLLVRHGLTATTGQVLTGWTPGVGLDDRGRAQARALGTRIAPVALDAVVTSPLDRCRQTVAELIAARNGHPGLADPIVEDRAHPSAVRFPGPEGESMLDMQHRAVSAIREWNERLGQDATYLVCSHGDVIKAIVADSLGLHLDQCQRIIADPCSLTVINYTPMRPFLLRLNDTGGGVADLLPSAKQPSAGSDAVIGGGAGTSAVAPHSPRTPECGAPAPLAPQPQSPAAGPTDGNEIGPAENEGAEVGSSKNKAAEVGARTDADGAEG